MTESENIQELMRRIERVESVQSRLDIEGQTLRLLQGVGSVEQKNILLRLDKIESVLSRLTWLVISAVIGSSILFMLKGGFNGTFPVIP